MPLLIVTEPAGVNELLIVACLPVNVELTEPLGVYPCTWSGAVSTSNVIVSFVAFGVILILLPSTRVTTSLASKVVVPTLIV